MACDGNGWYASMGEYPHPPANVTVHHSFKEGCLDIRWDDPRTLNTGPVRWVGQATVSILVSGTPKIETKASQTITVTGAPVLIGGSLLIGQKSLSAFPGTRTPGANNFDGSLGDPEDIAQEIANAINDFNNAFREKVTATAAGNVVTVVAEGHGELGNFVMLSSNIPELDIPSPFLEGGTDADTLSINGKTLTAVMGPRDPGGKNFSVDGDVFAIAQDLADAIMDPENMVCSWAKAVADSAKVVLTAVPIGSAGNDIGLETTSTVLTLSGDQFSGGFGSDKCPGKSNEGWEIAGVNIYRSDTGERGPYFRVNHLPVGSRFFRDCTSNVLVQEEVIDWDTQWVSKGDAANNARWRLKTRYSPIVKAEGQAVMASSPMDVVLRINGVRVPVHEVFGATGEVDLINVNTYDPTTERIIEPLLPSPDATVTLTYHRKGNLIRTALDHTAKVFYRVTTVAIDPTGESPSGYVETPLGFAQPVTVLNTETLDYIWREAIRRNRWILEQGGERVKVFIRREVGTPCSYCRWDARTLEYTKQPDSKCEYCFGTGYEGGYEGPIDLIVGPDEAPRTVSQTPEGRRLEHSYDVWTGPSPMLSQRDFIVKQNGERYSIGPVTRTQVRGVTLQQSFQIQYLDEFDVRYKVPVVGPLEWPQTRITRPQDGCDPFEPYPVGYDYQATPMGTDVPKIPEGRQQRGRTPVWANLTYGGKGGK